MQCVSELFQQRNTPQVGQRGQPERIGSMIDSRYDDAHRDPNEHVPVGREGRRARHAAIALAALFLSISSTLAQQPEATGPLALEDAALPVEELTDILLDQVKKTRLEAAWADVTRIVRLGRRHGSKVTEKLEKVLEGDDERMKLIAARALCQLNDVERAAPVLRNLLLEAKDPHIRRLAANSIGLSPRLYDDTETPRILEKVLDKETDGRVRVSAARTIWRIGLRSTGKKVLAELMKQSPDATIRNEAALVLAEFGMLVPINTWKGQPDEHLKRDVYRHILNLSLEPTAQGERAFCMYRRMERQPLENNEKVAQGMRLLREILMQIHTSYPDQHQVDVDQLFEHAGKGLVQALDPFSQYMDRQEVRETQEMLRQDYGGIGVYVALRDRCFRVISPIYPSPAYEAGMRAMDIILEVDGEKASCMLDNGGMARIITKLKGAPGTDVRVKFTRRGFTKPIEVTIQRASIGVKSVLHQVLPGKIGYVRVRRFGERTPDELDSALKSMQKTHGVRGIILDLRDNPGGLLRSGVDVADRFLAGNKLITYSKGRENSAPRKDYYSTGDVSDEAFPLVVLVNQGSASASEIVAGAIKDHQRAPLIGERTYGKGSVQQIIPLRTTRNQTQLRLTIAKYYLPTGRCIHGTGILPDETSQPKQLDDWTLRQLHKLRNGCALEDYARDTWKTHRKLLTKLAEEGDGYATDSYPEFEALFKRLDAYRLDKNAIRKELRRTVRKLSQDARGQEYACDLQSDETLQRGVFELLGKLRIDPTKVVQYKGYAEKFRKKTENHSALGAFVTPE